MVLLTLLLQAALASAACTRQSLIATRDAFFKAGAINSPGDLKLASGAKIALNNGIITLSATPFVNLTGFTDLKVEAVDTEACQIVTFRVCSTQVLSTRLKADESGTISEVEFLQAVEGDQFFTPTGFPSTTPALWASKQNPGLPPNVPTGWSPIGGTPAKYVNTTSCKAGNGTARLLTRTELLYVAATYADGLRGAPWDGCIVGGTSCPRNENGVVTTQNCAVGAGSSNFLTRGRRWVVDTETAIVSGFFFFDTGGTPPANTSVGLGTPVEGNAPGEAIKLFLDEYFKIEAGVLVGIYAPMKRIPGPQAAASTFSGEA